MVAITLFVLLQLADMNIVGYARRIYKGLVMVISMLGEILLDV
jgi:hypothetical protein